MSVGKDYPKFVAPLNDDEAADPSQLQGRGVLGIIRATLAVLAVAGPILWVMDVPRSLFGMRLYTEQLLTFELAVVLPLLFLSYDIRGYKTLKPRWYDLITAALGSGSAGYLMVDYPRLVNELMFLPIEGVIISAMLVILTIEGVRRSVGLMLAIIVMLLIAYGYWGHMLPSPYTSRTMSFPRLSTYLGIDTNALLGISLQVGVIVVVPFIVLGKFLSTMGGSNFFSALAVAAMGRFRGGPGKIAVFGSSLMGSVSGSAVANVASTGVVTIPMMKRAGFPPHVAAGIESVASTGGQLMPPVIGAAAFLMAEFLSVSYATVMVAALLPIALYYIAIFILVDLYAARHGLAGVPRAQIPPLLPEFRQGWHFLLPFVVFLVLLLEFRYQPELAALYAIATLFVLVYLFGYHGRRPNLKTLWRAVYEAGESIVEIVIVTAAAGLVIGVLNLSGVSFTLAAQLLQIAGGNLYILLGIAAVASIVLGMGMPTVSVYILLATLIAPAIIQTGVPPLAAHMFVLYFGLLSMVTPPIAIASFAAANLAKASPWRSSWSAMWFGWTAYIIPFLFVLSPSMLLQGAISEAVVVAITAMLGVGAISIGIVGYAINRLGLPTRAFAMVAGILLLIPANAFEHGNLMMSTGFVMLAGLAAKLLIYDRRIAAIAASRDDQEPVTRD